MLTPSRAGLVRYLAAGVKLALVVLLIALSSTHSAGVYGNYAARFYLGRLAQLLDPHVSLSYFDYEFILAVVEKSLHVLIFGAFGACLRRVGGRLRTLIAVCILASIASEALQYLMARDAELLDIALNIASSLLGLSISARARKAALDAPSRTQESKALDRLTESPG